MSQITTTDFLLPGYVVSNGEATGSGFSNPDNILLVDDLLAESNPNGGSASDIEIGGFNANLSQDAIIVGIEMKLIAKVGAINVPPTTLTLYAVDNTSGENVSYPYTAPINSLTEDLATYILGTPNYLFGTTWTPDQINNLKFSLVANGDLYIDSFLLEVFYYIPDTPTPPDPIDGACETCNSVIQVQAMYLQVPFLIGQTKFYLQPGCFEYADGTPVQPGDVGDCGGEIDLVFDEGKKKSTTNNNFEENITLDLSNGYWTVLPSGIIEFDIGSVNNRGLMFHEPYTHVTDLMSDHDASAKVIISNNGKFYGRFVRRCQVDTVFSPPITVEDEGDIAVTALHTLNFIGANVQVEVDPMDARKADVTILADTTNTETTIDDTTEGTTGTIAASSLTFAHTVTTANYLRVWVSTQNAAISGVTYNGVPMTLVGAETNVAGNLKVALYHLINPAMGTHNVVVSMGSAVVISAGAISWNDVDTSNPVDGLSSGAFGSSTAPSDTVTTTVENTVLMDVVGGVNNTTAFTQTYPWGVRSQINASTRPGASSTRRVLVPAVVTDTYSISPTGAWAIIVAGVRGISTPIGGVQSVTGLDTDNTDPENPIVKVAVDGVTITGDGTPGNPLQAPGGGSGSVVSVSVATAHGFQGTSDGDPVSPELTLGTTQTGILRGDDPDIVAITDPTFDGLLGWDDTDDASEYFHLGAGLNYDSPTKTLSAPGTGGAGFNVSADETITNFVASEIILTAIGGVSNTFANGLYLVSNAGPTAISGVLIGNGGAGFTDAFEWDGTKIVRLECTFSVSVGAAGSTSGASVGYGFAEAAADLDLANNNKKIGLLADSTGVLFAVTSDGSATTSTSTGIAYTNVNKAHRCVIVWDPVTPKVDFWVDGNLVATHGIGDHIPNTGTQPKICQVARITSSGISRGRFTYPVFGQNI